MQPSDSCLISKFFTALFLIQFKIKHLNFFSGIEATKDIIKKEPAEEEWAKLKLV